MRDIVKLVEILREYDTERIVLLTSISGTQTVCVMTHENYNLLLQNDKPVITDNTPLQLLSGLSLS